MWKCVFGEMDMCICLCQNTGAMNRPLRLAECFVVISWVFVALLTIRLQRNGRLLASVGLRFIAPVSTNTPKLYCVFMPLALQFASFRHIKTIWVGLKNGCYESAPMPYVLFVAIHLRNKWILRIVLCHIFCTINKWYGVCVGVFIYVHLRCLLCE